MSFSLEHLDVGLFKMLDANFREPDTCAIL